MSAHAPAHHDHDGDPVYFQFEDIDQQQETYIIGMWSFLVTEVMFFGAMFLIYTLYRFNFHYDFYISHISLNQDIAGMHVPLWGGINTFILLVSSFSFAAAVHHHMKKNKKEVMKNLWIVQICAVLFLVFKFTFEWKVKFEHGLIPDKAFAQHYTTYALEHGYGAMPDIARLFFSLYFTMTGLHALHIIIGILIIGVLMYKIQTDDPIITDYVPTEMIGLYWHFVDLVWIFLFPLFYLIPA